LFNCDEVAVTVRTIETSAAAGVNNSRVGLLYRSVMNPHIYTPEHNFRKYY